MRQILSTARHQTRPPVALMGWLGEPDEESPGIWATQPSNLQRRTSPGGSCAPFESTPTCNLSNDTPLLGSISSFPIASLSYPSRNFSATENTIDPQRSRILDCNAPAKLTSSRHLSSLATPTDDNAESDTDRNDISKELDDLPSLFQTLILTRRSRSHFAPLSPSIEPSFWISALDRAVNCAYAAPNHKRTDPFTFKRLLAPSSKTERLAEIAASVNLRQNQEKQKHQPSHFDRNHAELSARRKAEKWSQIPAWLVATVHSPSQSPALVNQTTVFYDEIFRPLSFQPVQSERELEDYASACAAVQNVLLSLHAEGIGSKWATGPVVYTPAFRDLMELQPEDRVVALIQVGLPNSNTKHSLASHRHPRRHRRQLHGDVLVDL